MIELIWKSGKSAAIFIRDPLLFVVICSHIFHWILVTITSWWYFCNRLTEASTLLNLIENTNKIQLENIYSTYHRIVIRSALFHSHKSTHIIFAKYPYPFSTTVFPSIGHKCQRESGLHALTHKLSHMNWEKNQRDIPFWMPQSMSRHVIYPQHDSHSLLEELVLLSSSLIHVCLSYGFNQHRTRSMCVWQCIKYIQIEEEKNQGVGKN